MPRHLTTLGSIVAALAAMTIASGPAFAQQSGATKVTGTATTAGNLKRTITDIPGEPNGIEQVTSTVINVPIGIGDNATTIAANLKNTINADVTLQGLKFSSVYTTPSATVNLQRPKMVRQVGTYTQVDLLTGASGVTATDSPFTVEDAPAISPVGLGFLVGALPALAFWTRRRKKASA